jgi:hypothetical protein
VSVTLDRLVSLIHERRRQGETLTSIALSRRDALAVQESLMLNSMVQPAEPMIPYAGTTESVAISPVGSGYVFTLLGVPVYASNKLEPGTIGHVSAGPGCES